MPRITDAIKQRRSIRKYSPRPISPEILREILEAAGDASLKQQLSKAMADVWVADMIKDGIRCEARENQRKTSVEQFTNAPVLIVACLTMKDMLRYADESRQKSERDMLVLRAHILQRNSAKSLEDSR